MALLLNWRVWVAVAFAALLAFTHITIYRAGRHAVQTSWDAAKVATEQAAQEQATRNRELQRAAELKYVVQGEAREKFFVTTVKEIRDASAPLASCPVPADVVRLLNDANHCASGDSPASCGAPEQVPDAR